MVSSPVMQGLKKASFASIFVKIAKERSFF